MDIEDDDKKTLEELDEEFNKFFEAIDNRPCNFHVNMDISKMKNLKIISQFEYEERKVEKPKPIIINEVDYVSKKKKKVNDKKTLF